MRIRHILPQPAMGSLPSDPTGAALTGVVNTAWKLALRQAADGHDVEIIAPGEHRRSHNCAGVRLRWLPQWGRLRSARYDFSYVAPLMSYSILAKPVDVAHVHSNPFLLTHWGARARVLHFQNSPEGGSAAYSRAVARADRIICCSSFIRRQVAEAVGYPRTQLHVVPNGVDRSVYIGVDRTAARAAYGIQDEQVVLLYVGRIGPEKGLHVLVAALEHAVASSNTQLLLLVAGSATLGYEGYRPAWRQRQRYEDQLRARAAGLPIRFLGNVPHRDLAALYRAADIFVCPSVYQEPFGMVNIEAAAAGIPVLGSAVGGIPEAILDGRTGLLVPPDDSRALGEAIVSLATEPARRKQYGRAAVEFAAQHDWQHLAERVSLVYEAALRGSNATIAAHEMSRS